MLKNAALLQMKKKVKNPKDETKKEDPPPIQTKDPPTTEPIHTLTSQLIQSNISRILADPANIEIDDGVIPSPPPKEQQKQQAVVSPTSVAAIDAPIVVDFDPFQIENQRVEAGQLLEEDDSHGEFLVKDDEPKQSEPPNKKSVGFVAKEEDDDGHGEFILHSVSDDASDDMVYPGKDMEEEDVATPTATGALRKQDPLKKKKVVTPEQQRPRSSKEGPRSRSNGRHRAETEDDTIIEEDRRRNSTRSNRRNSSSGGAGGLFSCGDFDDDISDTFRLITQPLKNFKRCGPKETEAVVKDIKRGTLARDVGEGFQHVGEGLQRGGHALDRFLTEKLKDFRDYQEMRAEIRAEEEERKRKELERWRKERGVYEKDRYDKRSSSASRGGRRLSKPSRSEDEYDGRGGGRRSHSASRRQESYSYEEEEESLRGGSELGLNRRGMA